jgi:hypothetical protein
MIKSPSSCVLNKNTTPGPLEKKIFGRSEIDPAFFKNPESVGPADPDAHEATQLEAKTRLRYDDALGVVDPPP